MSLTAILFTVGGVIAAVIVAFVAMAFAVYDPILHGKDRR